jgi:hypothetical protein
MRIVLALSLAFGGAVLAATPEPPLWGPTWTAPFFQCVDATLSRRGVLRMKCALRAAVSPALRPPTPPAHRAQDHHLWRRVGV